MKKLLSLALLCLGLGTSAKAQAPAPAAIQPITFSYMSLPYELNALEPAISAQTMALHYGKHLKAYVDNLNKAGYSPDRPQSTQALELAHILRYHHDASLKNNAGQVLNHELYFLQFSPKPRRSKIMEDLLGQRWGSVEYFQNRFEQSASTLFGSGWVWLVLDPVHASLEIVRTKDGSNPIEQGNIPLLGVDLWEHAYYLDYQNKRMDHVKALWQIIDWKVVEDRYFDGVNGVQ